MWLIVIISARRNIVECKVEKSIIPFLILKNTLRLIPVTAVAVLSSFCQHISMTKRFGTQK